MAKSNFITGIAVAVFCFCIWAYLNQPREEPPWPDRVQGFCVSPMQAGQSPLIQKYPTESQIRSDMRLLAERSRSVRTYAVEHSLSLVPRLAGEVGMQVTLGAWVDADRAKTEKEMADLIRIAGAHASVARVIVGNEVVLRGDIPKDRLMGYLEQARQALDVPVSTAEPWHVWLKHPDLADHVDYLAVHMLPYWEGIHVDAAVDYIVAKIDALKARFPEKPVIIAEVGWPSNGRTREGAVASVANEAIFLRRFLERAEQEDYIYYLMEAFDQPWKRETEGAVGAYWGVYDVHRAEKFPFTASIVAIPHWHLLAGISVLIAGIIFALLLVDSGQLKRRGCNFLAMVAFFAATIAVWIIYNHFHQYWTAGTVIAGGLILVGMIGVILVLLTEAHEWAEAMWVTERRRSFTPANRQARSLPVVSIHVPAYNEPPEMLKETLDALARLDYPDYEVLVIDNNTPDPRTWQPVADHCRRLGPRFRFVHVAPLAGFKAGALNHALSLTRTDAEIIAVIDSDYTVAPGWLADLTPCFDDPGIALVQAPQDYRDHGASLFKAICHSEYKGFFHIGMVTRNERNAIIQHGTMTLVRRQALARVNGWGEWCITEDAELGLRIFEQGGQGLYVRRSYGKGLMPDTFGDYQQQRFRWAYGAVQILRRHAGALLGGEPTRLTRGQCYHFIAGWLPWMAEGANLIFNLAALILSLVMICAPDAADPPLAAISFLLLAMFVFKVSKQLYLYRTKVGATLAQTFAALLAGFALSHTVARAVLFGLMTRDMPFRRTPKLVSRRSSRVWGAIWQEFALMASLAAAAWGVYLNKTPHNADLYLWVAVLVIQAIPYGASVLMAIISAGQSGPQGFGMRNWLKLIPHPFR